MIGNLSLDQLRVLVAIADAGSFSAAGRRIGRAQSAISQAVAGLEATQGVQLFDRSGHRPQLTEIGRLLVDQARMVLASAARFTKGGGRGAEKPVRAAAGWGKRGGAALTRDPQDQASVPCAGPGAARRAPSLAR